MDILRVIHKGRPSRKIRDGSLPRHWRIPWKSGATTATLSPDGTLRVKGIGAMEDYDRRFPSHGSPIYESDLISINPKDQPYAQTHTDYGGGNGGDLLGFRR